MISAGMCSAAEPVLCPGLQKRVSAGVLFCQGLPGDQSFRTRSGVGTVPFLMRVSGGAGA